ncbi:MAG: Stf0 family sulfotransferase [Rhizomicrobium sp.]
MVAGGNDKQDSQHIYDLISANADYPKWVGQPRRTIVICTQQRSGSTLLGEAIYFAGGLGCPLEYFHEGFQPLFEARWKPADFQAYVSTLHSLRTDSTGVFSTKLFWRDAVRLMCQFAPAEFNMPHWTADTHISHTAYRRAFSIFSQFLPNPTFVFLTRRNTVRQAVSFSIAGETRLWREFSGSSPKHKMQEPAYDFNRVLRILAVIQKGNAHWSNFFRANDLQHHEVVYEDLAENYENTMRSLFEAVGRPEAAIMPARLRRQADARSEEILEQFLADFRRRTPV